MAVSNEFKSHEMGTDVGGIDIDFKKLNLNLAFGLSFPLTKYWYVSPFLSPTND